jgi:polysaccharide biosynthesis transport protein
MNQNEFIEIDLREIGIILLKKWYFIVVCFVLATGSTFVVTRFYMDKVYRAETTLFLGKEKDKIGGLSFTDLQVSNQLVVDYREMLKTRLVAERIKDKIGVDPSVFQKGVDVKTVKDSRLLSISYEDTDPEIAARVVNELGNIIAQLAADIIEVKNVRIIDTAVVPTAPVKPSLTTNVGLAGVLGILLGVGLIYLLELVDNTFKKPDELEKKVGMAVVGTIPRLAGGNRTKDKQLTEKEYLANMITINDPKAPASEAYRELRTNLHFKSVDQQLKSLVVTSSSLGDGKTVTAANLAVVMAKSGKSVVIVDADLRKPKLDKYFGISPKAGLTNVFTDDKGSVKLPITEIKDVPNLHVITSGPVPPNPSELLSSKKAEAFFKELREQYDLVIIDTPPVGVVTDAAIVSGIADGTLVVVAAGQTRQDAVKRSLKALENVKDKITGFVMTKLDLSRNGYYSYEYK